MSKELDKSVTLFNNLLQETGVSFEPQEDMDARRYATHFDGAVHRIDVMRGEKKLTRIFVEEAKGRFAAIHDEQRDTVDRHYFNDLLKEGNGGRGHYGLDELFYDIMHDVLTDERDFTELTTAREYYLHEKYGYVDWSNPSLEIRLLDQ